jgi:hypothetical protein
MVMTCLLGPATLSASSLQSNAPDGPCRAKRIYVAELGESGEVERFRRELKRQLARKKFVLVARAEDADGVLAGRFSHSGSGRESKLAFESGELKDGRGERLWHGNFYFTRASIKSVASAVSANLRNACRR